MEGRREGGGIEGRGDREREEHKKKGWKEGRKGRRERSALP